MMLKFSLKSSVESNALEIEIINEVLQSLQTLHLSEIRKKMKHFVNPEFGKTLSPILQSHITRLREIYRLNEERLAFETEHRELFKHGPKKLKKATEVLAFADFVIPLFDHVKIDSSFFTRGKQAFDAQYDIFRKRFEYRNSIEKKIVVLVEEEYRRVFTSSNFEYMKKEKDKKDPIQKYSPDIPNSSSFKDDDDDDTFRPIYYRSRQAELLLKRALHPEGFAKIYEPVHTIAQILLQNGTLTKDELKEFESAYILYLTAWMSDIRLNVHYPLVRFLNKIIIPQLENVNSHIAVEKKKSTLKRQVKSLWNLEDTMSVCAFSFYKFLFSFDFRRYSQNIDDAFLQKQSKNLILPDLQRTLSGISYKRCSEKAHLDILLGDLKYQFFSNVKEFPPAFLHAKTN